MGFSLDFFNYYGLRQITNIKLRPCSNCAKVVNSFGIIFSFSFAFRYSPYILFFFFFLMYFQRTLVESLKCMVSSYIWKRKG